MKEQIFTVYCLHSYKFNQIYIGFTSDLIDRFHSHNQLATKGHTIKYRPWMVAYLEVFESKTEAMKREKQLKSANGRKFLKEFIAANY